MSILSRCFWRSSAVLVTITVLLFLVQTPGPV
jgi:hypothetical protein